MRAGGSEKHNFYRDISREIRCFEGLFCFLLIFFPLPTAIVGPPTLSWLFQGHSLSINVSVPLTPFRSKKGSYKPVNKVLLKLWYWLHLYDGEVLTQQVRGRGGKRAKRARGMQKFPGATGMLWSPHPIAQRVVADTRGLMVCTPPKIRGWKGTPFPLLACRRTEK